MEKVNQMNTDTGIEALVLATAFAILPQELTFKLAASTLFLGGLYLLKGKIPESMK